jgi:hypothetical protein
MFHQAFHGKPITGGRVARESLGAGLVLEGKRIEDWVHTFSPRWNPDAAEQVRRIMSENRVKWVVLHRGETDPLLFESDRARLGSWLDEVGATGTEALFRVY